MKPSQRSNPPPDDDARASGGAPHPAGVWRVCFVFAVLAAAAAVPYLAPVELTDRLGIGPAQLGRLEAWRPGSPVPLARIFDFRLPTRPAIAGAQQTRAQAPSDDGALLDVAPLPPALELPPRGSPGGDERLRVPPGEYAGLTRTIEAPQASMAHFYRVLADVARRQPGVLARVLVYSDSINGSDQVTRSLRHAFARRFGDGGKGFVPIRPGWQYQRQHDVEWRQGGSFQARVVNRGRDETGRYGLGGVVAENRTPVAWASFSTVKGGPVGSMVSRFQLFYQAWPGGGRVRLTVDGRMTREVSLLAPALDDRVADLRVPDGPHELRVSVVRGAARLYGVVMERDGPGVVVDGLMLVGAFTRVLLNFDAAHWARQLELRRPDLVVFWLGGNDSVSDTVPFVRSRFIRDFKEVLGRARAGRPEASCLVVSALDSAEEVEGAFRSRRVVPRVVSAQRETALAAGCAFFDAYEAMGGGGAMVRWHRASPRLVSVDYRHLTPNGARVIGSLLYRALLRGYDESLRPAAGTPVGGVGSPE